MVVKRVVLALICLILYGVLAMSASAQPSISLISENYTCTGFSVSYSASDGNGRDWAYNATATVDSVPFDTYSGVAAENETFTFSGTFAPALGEGTYVIEVSGTVEPSMGGPQFPFSTSDTINCVDDADPEETVELTGASYSCTAFEVVYTPSDGLGGTWSYTASATIDGGNHADYSGTVIDGNPVTFSGTFPALAEGSHTIAVSGTMTSPSSAVYPFSTSDSVDCDDPLGPIDFVSQTYTCTGFAVVYSASDGNGRDWAYNATATVNGGSFETYSGVAPQDEPFTFDGVFSPALGEGTHTIAVSGTVEPSLGGPSFPFSTSGTVTCDESGTPVTPPVATMDDGRICFGAGEVRVAVYVSGGGFAVYAIAPDDTGELAMIFTSAELAALDYVPGTPLKFAERDLYIHIEAWRQANGLYRVFAGPDAEGKLFECAFAGLNSRARSYFPGGSNGDELTLLP